MFVVIKIEKYVFFVIKIEKWLTLRLA